MTKAPGPERLEHFLYNHPVRCHRLSLIARISFVFIQLARSSLPFYLPRLFATRYNLPSPFPFHLSQTLPQSADPSIPFFIIPAVQREKYIRAPNTKLRRREGQGGCSS